MRRMRKYFVQKLHKGMAVSLLAIIIVIVAANIIKKDDEMSVRENRMLEQRPKITLADVSDGKFMKDYESYVSDQFILRDLWVSAKARMDLLLGKNNSNGIYKGKSGYLIEDAKTPDDANMTKNINAINKLADSGNVNVYSMIVPNAVCVLDNKLPAFAPVRDQEADLKAFSARLSSNVKQIDLITTFKGKRDSEQLYYRNDHHWTTAAAYLAFQKAAGTLGIDADKVSYDRYTVSSQFSGTLAATSGYGASKKDTIEIFAPNNSDVEYVVEYVEQMEKKASVYDSEMLDNNDKYAVFFGGNYPIIKIKTTNREGRSLLVIKDSYANCFVPFLIPHYKEIIMIDPRYYYDDVNKEIADSKIQDVLFLYNANTFFEDNSLSSIFEAYADENKAGSETAAGGGTENQGETEGQSETQGQTETAAQTESGES